MMHFNTLARGGAGLILLFLYVPAAVTAQISDKISTTSRALMIPRLELDDSPAAILYTIPGMEGPPLGNPFNPDDFEFYRIHVAAWRDGRIIWSTHSP